MGRSREKLIKLEELTKLTEGFTDEEVKLFIKEIIEILIQEGYGNKKLDKADTNIQ